MRLLLLLALLVAGAANASGIDRFKAYLRTTQSARAEFEQKVYDRELAQVTVRKLTKALGSTPAALLAGSSDIEAAFDLSDAGERDGLEWLEAKPKEREAGFDRIRIGLGSAGVQAMELTDNFGQTTELRFSGLVRNPKVDLGEFRFEPPKGTDVLGDQ